MRERALHGQVRRPAVHGENCRLVFGSAVYYIGNDECEKIIMKRFVVTAALASLLCGCSTVYTRTNPYLGISNYPATKPDHVQILSAEPKNRPHDRLGEVFLDIGGSPSKKKLEKKLKAAAANLGGDAVFVVSDQTRIFPVVYVDWWGPTFTQDARRGIIAVVVKFK